MGTRFTRVTVVGDGRQIDISLPADSPVSDQLPTVLRLLSVPSTPLPVRWQLSAPEFGPIEPARSLDEVGVLDGAQLYLTEASSAAPAPFVDDVESTVAELVADRAPSWTGAARRSAVGLLMAMILIAGLATGLGATAPISVLAPAMVLVAAILAGGLITEPGGFLCALVAVPGVDALVLGVVAARPSLVGSGSEPDPTALAALSQALDWNGFPLVMAIGAALALMLVGVVRALPGLTVGGLAVAIVSAAALVCARAGMPADRTAGLALVVAVLLSGLAGQFALGGAGLVDLMVADERGEPVPRITVAAAVRRGLGLASGLVWAAALVAALACAIMIVRVPDPAAPASWTAPAVGALGGLLFGLRSRMFSRAQHVGPMLGVMVLTVVVVAFRAPSWLAAGGSSGSVFTLLVLLVAGLLGGVAGLQSLREVAGARLQRTLERLELLGMLALVPGLVLLFRVIPMVQRWWS